MDSKHRATGGAPLPIPSAPTISSYSLADRLRMGGVTPPAAYQPYTDPEPTGWSWWAIGLVLLLFLVILAGIGYMIFRCHRQYRGCWDGIHRLHSDVERWHFRQSNTISNSVNTAKHVDTNLINPWGIALDTRVATQSFVWVAEAGTGFLEQFTLTTTPGTCPDLVLAQTITVVPPSGPTSTPTGVVVQNNVSSTAFSFTVGLNTGPAQVLVATRNGTINAFNSTLSPTTAPVVVNGSGSSKVYTGLAMHNSQLFVTDFANGAVEVYDSTFTLVTSFTDAALTAIGYNPYNVTVSCDGLVYVGFALVDTGTHLAVTGQGNGYINVYDTAGNFKSRLVSRGDLNTPWALLALGKCHLMVGNSGDGKVLVYDTRRPNQILDDLKDEYGNTLYNDGVLGLLNLRRNREPPQLVFAAGIQLHTGGLVGFLQS